MLAIVGATLLASPGLTLRVTDFGLSPDSGQDATPVFQRVIAQARSSRVPVRIVVPRGNYHFFSQHATRRKAYLSNCTEPFRDATRTIALDLSDLRNVSLVGDGAKFLMRGKMTMVVAERSRNLRLQGIEFDSIRPTVSEMTAIEKGDGYWIASIHPDSRFRIQDNRIVWVGENWEGTHNLVQHYDPQRQTTWRDADPVANATRIEQVGPMRLRIEVPPETLSKVTVGWTYQLRDRVRDESAMWFSRCQDVVLEDVIARALPSFGLLFQFTQNVTIRGLEVTPDPASGRTTVAAADILHFSGCRGRIRVLNSTLDAAHDDAINVHGTHLQISDLLPDGRVRVRFMHPQTFGFLAFTAGDKVEFIRQSTMLPYGEAVVRAVEQEDLYHQVLTLDRSLPEGVEVGRDALENATWTPSLEVAHCKIMRVPTRGILVTTRRKVEIHDNLFFRVPMASILVEDDARGWYESGYVRDLRVYKNRFFECRGPVIEINPQNETFGGYVHRGLRVTGNTFERCGSPLVEARALDGLQFQGNRIDGGVDGPAVKAVDVRNARER